MKKIFLFLLVTIFIGGLSYSVYAQTAPQSDTASCPLGYDTQGNCGGATISVSGLNSIINSASVDVTISATGIPDQTKTITFQRAGCTAVDATLTVDNGRTSTTTYPGTPLTYTWTSICSDYFTSGYTYTCTSPTTSGGPTDWIATGSAGDTQTATVAPSQANCTYTYTYTAKNTSTNVSKSASVVVNVLPLPSTPAGSWTYSAWSPWSTCSSGTQTQTQTRTASCVDSQGNTSTACDPNSRQPLTQSQACPQNSANACGSSSGVPAASAPSSNLCGSGFTASSVSLDNQAAAYTWSCNKTGSGAICSAPYTGPISGQCGGAVNVEAPTVPNGNFCYVGQASALTHNNDDTYSWTCSGSNGGSPSGTCTTAVPSTCTEVAVTSDKSALFSGTNTTLHWVSNCAAVRVKDPAGAFVPVCDQQTDSGCTVYNAYNRPPTNSSLAGVTGGTWTVVGYSDNGYGFGPTIAGPSAQVNIASVDFAIRMNSNFASLARGDRATFQVTIPFGQCVNSNIDPDNNPQDNHCVPIAFPSSLSGVAFSLSNVNNPLEEDRYTDPSTGGSWFPSLTGKDIGPSVNNGQIGTFSPTTLSATGAYVSNLNVTIPTNVLPGTYHYTVNAFYGGSVRSYPLVFNITNGVSKSLTLTVNKTIGGSVISNDGGINCGATCSNVYAKNTVVTLSAVPSSASWKFIGWSGACTGTVNTCSVTMNIAKNVSAKFSPTPIQYQEF